MQTHDLESRIREALAASPTGVALGEVEDVPLAFNVSLPDQPFGNGHISIRFERLELDTRAHCDITVEQHERGATAKLRWPRMALRGSYAVTAVALPAVMLDTGGTMHEGESDVPPLDPATRNAMLDNARAQRTRLMDQPHGQALLSQYDEHNEIYNTVFVTSAAARGAWAAGGATREMALDTHNAVNAEGVVNDPNKTYGPAKVTYNQNAFNQQLQIVVNTIAADPDFNPFDPLAKPDPNSPYTKASLAALTFGKAVGATGNTKADTRPLQREDIYAAVQSGSAPPPATIDELQNILDQGATAAKLESTSAAASEADRRGWRVLDDEDRALVRHHLEAAKRQRAEQLARPRHALWTGSCSAELADVEVNLEFADEGGGAHRLASCCARVPAFALNLDDKAWQGEAAAIARQRFAGMQFVRSLIRDRARDGLERSLNERLSRPSHRAPS